APPRGDRGELIPLGRERQDRLGQGRGVTVPDQGAGEGGKDRCGDEGNGQPADDEATTSDTGRGWGESGRHGRDRSETQLNTAKRSPANAMVLRPGRAETGAFMPHFSG